MYHLNYQSTHDIDWFCCVNRIPVHLASNGGHLPWNSYTIRDLVSLQHKVSNMEQPFKCAINAEYLEGFLQRSESYIGIENLSEEDFQLLLPEGFERPQEIEEFSRPLQAYCWSFIEMAKRGFFSFDRKERDNEYHLVAWPVDFDPNRFDQGVMDLLIPYEACCFPPFHKDYGSTIPKHIVFDVKSIDEFYRNNK